MDTREFERLQLEYNALRNALPPLPEPEDLYAKIIRVCRYFWISVKSVENLGLRVRSLRNTIDTWQERYTMCKILIETVARVRLEFLLIRSQLAALWALPSLLVATHKVESEVWRTMIRRQQGDDGGNPLLIDYTTMERAITDKLEVLKEYDTSLREYEEALGHESLQEERLFRAQILLELETLRDSIAERSSRESIVMDTTQREDDPVSLGQGEENTGEPEEREGIEEAMQESLATAQEIYQGHLVQREHEALLIRDNEQFVEPILEIEEEDESIDQELMVIDEEQSDEEEEHDAHSPAHAAQEEEQHDAHAPAHGAQEREHHASPPIHEAHRGHRARDVREDRRRQARSPVRDVRDLRGHQAPAPIQDVRHRRPPQPQDEIAQLRQQLQQQMQAVTNFNNMIEELEDQERCPIRTFAGGRIQNPNEERMPLANMYSSYD
ncbi:hypothetical protein GCK32_014429 [Trichostrongylus colubriformis]|uniref:Uncharacterized protein n=1 Tax=Trichostrongylus colubriformis TaxID=6319 RepID=A0AAN8IAG7_TRICO